jgi:hypothetical protein
VLAAYVIAFVMEAASTSEMSVNFYQITWSNNPEDSHLYSRRRGNLKSHFNQVYISQPISWTTISIFCICRMWFQLTPVFLVMTLKFATPCINNCCFHFCAVFCFSSDLLFVHEHERGFRSSYILHLHGNSQKIGFL